MLAQRRPGTDGSDTEPLINRAQPSSTSYGSLHATPVEGPDGVESTVSRSERSLGSAGWAVPVVRYMPVKSLGIGGNQRW